MKILFNTYQVAFDCPGGGEIQLMKTKEALERNGCEVLLYNQWSPQFNQTKLVHYFSSVGGSMAFCDYVKKIGLKLVIAPILWIDKWRERYPIDEIRALFTVADAVVPNSDIECDRLSDYFGIPRRKFRTVYNAVENIFFESADPSLFLKKFNIQGEFALCAGNIEERKNQLRLTKACLKAGIHLVLIGNPREKGYFERCMREGGKHITYLGYIDNKSELLRSAYASCSVFALPSLFETPGLAALEAAASGSRLVITAEGSTREYFGTDALYVDPEDEHSIYDALLEALSREKNDRLRERVKQFTWDNAAKRLIGIYSELLG